MDERVYQPESNKELAMPCGGDACATCIQLKVTNTILCRLWPLLSFTYGMANELKPFCDWDDEWQEAQRESTFFAEGDILGEI